MIIIKVKHKYHTEKHRNPVTC